MKELMRRAARYSARKLHAFGNAPAGAAVPQTSIAEITPMAPRESGFALRRLNLLVPSINAQHYFGGIHTAMQMFEAMAVHFDSSRIILTDASPDAAALDRFSRYTAVPAHEDSSELMQVVAFSDRYGKTLPVAREDHWLTTAWWTSYAAQQTGAWQARTYGTSGQLAYMIQDFEPGFYPWSSHSALAHATYRPHSDVGIFNTSLLADYFIAQGIGYDRRVVFEPTINDGLRARLGQARDARLARRKRIVVYARPGTPRNAFTLICEALRTWGWSDPRSAGWEVLAPGELLSDVDLGPLSLHAMGKLDIAAYAELLATSAVGLSLMVSPHPSYPPLEMAALGMQVVTNGFANKDLSLFSPNISSVETMTPEAIAKALALACDHCERHGMEPTWIMPADHGFVGEHTLGPAAEEAVRHMALR